MIQNETAGNLKSAYKKYEAKYSETIQEMLVLTSEFVGSASLFEEGIWEPSAEFLASVDLATGTFQKEKAFLNWLAEDKDKGTWIHNIRPLTIYHVRCRKRIQLPEEHTTAFGPSYMLVEVVGRDLEHPDLERIRTEYQRSVTFTDELCGRFELERSFDWFSGEVDWLGETCSVSLSCDEEDGETADNALASFKQVYSNLQEWDEKFRAFTAKALTSLANDWQKESEEEEPEPITEESFAKRIYIGEFSMEPDGNYTAYYGDDDMFWGHVILIEGNIETGIEQAYIAG